MLKFLVKQQKIEVLEREVIASDQIAFVNLKFTFDGDWKKFYKVVQFTQNDETFNRVLGLDGLSCLLPSELHAGSVKMSVFGYDTDKTDGLRATTVPVTLNIRQSGFVGDDTENEVPPTPDLYTQILQKIEKMKFGTPLDMSEYVKKEEIENIIKKALSENPNQNSSDYVTIQKLNDEIASIKLDEHSHTNKSVLDSITAIDRQLDETSTNPVANYVLALALDTLKTASHSHGNIRTLDKITEEVISEIGNLSQFQDRSKEQIHTLFEMVNTFNDTAHTHENIAVLNGITAEKVADWDGVTTLRMTVNSLSNNLTTYSERIGNNSLRIGANESSIKAMLKTMEALQNQMDAIGKNSAVTLFESGADSLLKYGEILYTFYNNGFRSLSGFARVYQNFCDSANNYALSYNQSDFGWAGVVYTICTTEIKIDSNSNIMFTYQSGATDNGEIYLIRKNNDYSGSALANYIYEQIEKKTAVVVPIKWLQCDTFISVLQSCEGVPEGQYFLAWKAVSDNTHPIIRTIKKLE